MMDITWKGAGLPEPDQLGHLEHLLLGLAQVTWSAGTPPTVSTKNVVLPPPWFCGCSSRFGLWVKLFDWQGTIFLFLLLKHRTPPPHWLCDQLSVHDGVPHLCGTSLSCRVLCQASAKWRWRGGGGGGDGGFWKWGLGRVGMGGAGGQA